MISLQGDEMNWFSRLFGFKKKGLGRRSRRCVACQGIELIELAPGAYRCSSCGYEGGSGYAAYYEGKNLTAMARLDEDELRRRALEELESLRLMVVALAGEVNPEIMTRLAAASDGLMIDLAPGETLEVDKGGLTPYWTQSNNRAERDYLRLQHQEKLIQANGGVLKLQQILSAWTVKEEHLKTADKAHMLVNSMQITESTPDERLHELQVLIQRVKRLLKE